MKLNYNCWDGTGHRRATQPTRKGFLHRTTVLRYMRVHINNPQEILGFCNFISHSSEEQSLRVAVVQEYLMFSNIYDLTAVLENR
ncbi:hypothetical protein PVAP13_2NG294003 [Panicum virgatum]|uniref:Uncharacterized protein n=1 Tax=Panicum virgatum TaxID=38727 RepID=A0A8T0VF28_PANVG|nr:hypothetical protein PVAP13_2NG294003 [Panicum virgatum]